MTDKVKNIFYIGRREFYSTAFNPIVLFLLAVGLVYIFINGAFGQFILTNFQSLDTVNDAFITGYRGVYAAEMIIFAIISGFLGVLCISDERERGSLKVLVSKPVYKADIILGKIVGLGGFMLSIVVLLHLLTGLLLMIFFREPYSAVDYLGRLFGFIASSFLQSMMIIGIGMLIGLLIRNIMVATSTLAVYIFLDFIGANTLIYIFLIPVLPSRFLQRILVPTGNVDLFDSGISVQTWFGLAAPHFVLMVLAVIIIIILDCAVFARQQEVE